MRTRFHRTFNVNHWLLDFHWNLCKFALTHRIEQKGEIKKTNSILVCSSLGKSSSFYSKHTHRINFKKQVFLCWKSSLSNIQIVCVLWFRIIYQISSITAKSIARERAKGIHQLTATNSTKIYILSQYVLYTRRIRSIVYTDVNDQIRTNGVWLISTLFYCLFINCV